jgi:hypothetical protein
MLFKNSVRTSKRTPHFTITTINWLTLFKEMIALYSENRTTPISTKIIELVTGKAGGTYSHHSALKGYALDHDLRLYYTAIKPCLSSLFYNTPAQRG